MARITSKSKLQQMKRKQQGLYLPIRLCIVVSFVSIILIMAFLLYQTDRAMFRQKIGSTNIATKQNSDRSMQKNILLAGQHQQRMNPNRLKKDTSEAANNNAPGSKQDQKQTGGDTEKAGASRRVELDLIDLKDGSTGTITIETLKEWAPLGVNRFWELIASDFYVQCKMFRVVPNFIAQFGIASIPSEHAKWQHQPIDDDPVVQSNLKYTVTFAMSGKNTRTTQLFINMKDNTYLDKQGFTPIGRITSGMEYIVQINDQYKELPQQNKIVHEGNVYLDQEFPGLTYISEIRILNDDEEQVGDDGNEQKEEHGDDENDNKGDDTEGNDEEEEEEGEEGSGNNDNEEEEEEEEEESEEKGDDGENTGDDKEN